MHVLWATLTGLSFKSLPIKYASANRCWWLVEPIGEPTNDVVDFYAVLFLSGTHEETTTAKFAMERRLSFLVPVKIAFFMAELAVSKRGTS